MKLIILFIICIFLSTSIHAQQISNEHIDGIIETLKATGKSDEVIQEIINGALSNPELFNEVWEKFITKKANSKWEYLNNLNIEFDTFQNSDSSNSSLGFSYDINFEYANFTEKGNNRVSNSFGLTANGNVAFDKKLNPYDFLETNINYSYSWYLGGVVQQNNQEYYNKLNEIEDTLTEIENPNSSEALSLWKEFGEYLTLSNQYYISISPKVGFEANQDFSKNQFAPGLQLNLGLKAWNKDSALSKANFLDYPFALLRLLTATDQSFTPYGSTIPTVQFGLDYVLPQNDEIRENLIGNADPFIRTKIETSFRTFISRVHTENIFFNANFRFYYELGAENEIKSANLDKHLYFVSALQSSSGFFVSYANGKLPFDLLNEEVYSIGFNYQF